MRRFLLLVTVLAGSVLAGLLLASVLLHQECPDCLGRQRVLEAIFRMEPEQPAPIDCPRCGDSGVVSLLNGRLGRAPDPLMTALVGHSNSDVWRMREARETFSRRLKESGVKTASGVDWDDFEGVRCRARFVREHGKAFVLLLLEPFVRDRNGGAPALVVLFEERGLLVDAVKLSVRGGPSVPDSQFVAPLEADGRCARIRLLTWKGRPYEEVEIDHAGKAWKQKPGSIDEKLGMREWTLQLRNGRLRVMDVATGNSIAD